MTRREARQLVSHGHFTLNGKKVNIPSIQLKAGDVVAICDKSRKSEKFKAVIEANAVKPMPKWLDVNRETAEGRLINLPEREDIDLPVEEHLIVELYSK
jgi:small subunit ribosomal protein S4